MNAKRLKRFVRSSLNRLLDPVGVRLVRADWGPRGFGASFARARALGFLPRQIVDAGAARGLWTAECRNTFPEANYFLIDPLPRNRRHLEALSLDHPPGGPQKVAYWLGALGAGNGTVEFHEHGDQSSVLGSEYSRGNPACRIKVPVRTLDSLFHDGLFSKPDVLKIGARGYELEVPRGARECLQSCVLVLLECNFQQNYVGACLFHEVVQSMADAGFGVLDLCTYVERPLDGQLGQADVVFAKLDSAFYRQPGWSVAL